MSAPDPKKDQWTINNAIEAYQSYQNSLERLGYWVGAMKHLLVVLLVRINNLPEETTVVTHAELRGSMVIVKAARELVSGDKVPYGGEFTYTLRELQQYLLSQ